MKKKKVYIAVSLLLLLIIGLFFERQSIWSLKRDTSEKKQYIIHFKKEWKPQIIREVGGEVFHEDFVLKNNEEEIQNSSDIDFTVAHVLAKLTKRQAKYIEKNKDIRNVKEYFDPLQEIK